MISFTYGTLPKCNSWQHPHQEQELHSRPQQLSCFPPSQKLNSNSHRKIQKIEEMAISSEKSVPEGKVWSLCKLPSVWSSTNNASASASSSSSSFRNHLDNGDHLPGRHNPSTMLPSMNIKSFLPTRRRLSLDPPNKLYFSCKLFTIHFEDCVFPWKFCAQLSPEKIILLMLS